MKIGFINFWQDFEKLQKEEPLNKWFFANLIEGEPCDDPKQADIIFSSVFGSVIVDNKPTIQFSGEFYHIDPTKFVANLICHPTRDNIISFPFAIGYLQSCPSAMNGITQVRNFRSIPEKFCCFIVSNDKSPIRNRMFQILSRYKKVDSYGRAFNNTGVQIGGTWFSDEIKSVISQYKFIICFENKWSPNYITEKIVNPLIVGTVPIYWGHSHVLDVFNEKSFLYLNKESPTERDLEVYCNKIQELDKNDKMYLEMRNESPLHLPKEYSLGQLKKNLRKLVCSI